MGFLFVYHHEVEGQPPSIHHSDGSLMHHCVFPPDSTKTHSVFDTTRLRVEKLDLRSII